MVDHSKWAWKINELYKGTINYFRYLTIWVSFGWDGVTQTGDQLIMSWQGSYRTSPSHYSGGCPNLSYYSSISRPINFPSWWMSARMGFWKAAGTKRKGNCEQVLCTDLQWPWTTMQDIVGCHFSMGEWVVVMGWRLWVLMNILCRCWCQSLRFWCCWFKLEKNWIYSHSAPGTRMFWCSDQVPNSITVSIILRDTRADTMTPFCRHLF